MWKRPTSTGQTKSGIGGANGEEGSTAFRLIKPNDGGPVEGLTPYLPFGGYYALGVCNDVNAMIELHMQGETSLFPLTHDPELFLGSRRRCGAPQGGTGSGQIRRSQAGRVF